MQLLVVSLSAPACLRLEQAVLLSGVIVLIFITIDSFGKAGVGFSAVVMLVIAGHGDGKAAIDVDEINFIFSACGCSLDAFP